MFEEDRFLVIAEHSTRHGLAANPILFTEDLRKAVSFALNAERLGYEFNSSECDVSIYLIVPEVGLHKKDFAFSGDKAPWGHPAVYCRRKVDGKWIEEWFQPYYEKKFAESLPKERKKIIDGQIA